MSLRIDLSLSRRDSIAAVARGAAFVYGIACYLVFVGTFVYSVAFVQNLFVARSIDAPGSAPAAQAIVIDLSLIALFGIQHSVMARPSFKKWWTRIMPQAIERSTFVLLSSICLILLMGAWQPISTDVWWVENALVRASIEALSWFGWVLTLVSTYAINHWDLFGLEQVYRNLRSQGNESPQFKTPMLYKLVRHPMMLGLVIAFWATPRMTTGHLLYSLAMTIYILVGIRMEERDLARQFGEQYKAYADKTSMLVPLPASKHREGAN